MGALQALAPTVPPSEVHRHVHGAATALQAALVEGVPLHEILDALVGLTAPAAPEAPPAPPWAPLLSLTLDDFAETGAALGVAYPALAASTWWTGPEAQARRIAAERRLTLREIWRLDRLQQEARQAGLDPETVTVVEALGGGAGLAAGGMRRGGPRTRARLELTVRRSTCARTRTDCPNSTWCSNSNWRRRVPLELGRLGARVSRRAPSPLTIVEALGIHSCSAASPPSATSRRGPGGSSS